MEFFFGSLLTLPEKNYQYVSYIYIILQSFIKFEIFLVCSFEQFQTCIFYQLLHFLLEWAFFAFHSVYTYIWALMHAYAHTHMHFHTHIHAHKLTHAYAHLYTCLCTFVHQVLVCVTCMYTHTTCSHTHSCIIAYRQTCMQAHGYKKHMHTHSFVPAHKISFMCTYILLMHSQMYMRFGMYLLLHALCF